MNSQSFKLLIKADGEITAIYSDALAEFFAEGKAETTRASHVEPSPDGGWTAAMVDGPTLGPFRLRSEALAAEMAYLEQSLF